MKILTLNLGNSRAAAGWFARGKIQRAARSVSISPVILEAVANGELPDGICVGSVVPKTNATWRRLLRQTFPRVPVLWMDHRLDMGIKLDLKRPDQTGHDRLADAVAAADLCGTPCIVCDFGTATTFNLVLSRRGFVGGVIAPGYGMWFEALAGAAQLPELKPGGIKVKTGRNTEEAIRLGGRWGYRGMITEILRHLATSCGRREPELCATGGYARKVLNHTGLKMKIYRDLTLEGLGRIALRNFVE